MRPTSEEKAPSQVASPSAFRARVPRTNSSTIAAKTKAQNVYATSAGALEPAPRATSATPHASANTAGPSRLAPSDRSAIWLAKGIATLAFLAVAEVVALPAFALFFSPVGWSTVAGVLLADLGICAVGTLLAAMAAAGRARELLLPLLFLPLALPIVIGGVGASVAHGSGRYLAFLALYDAIFALLAWASFEYVVTE